MGFGAQTLVRDIISGAFYLMDDAFRLGEYIDVGDAKGTVEKIGIRSMQLRHHRGPVNIVPYGAIRRMTNQSRDWVVEKLEFRLTYDTDIAKVKKIIKRIGQELAADPEMGPHILQPLKSQGVLAMEDSAMLVKAKFTAKPGEQFVILPGGVPADQAGLRRGRHPLRPPPGDGLRAPGRATGRCRGGGRRGRCGCPGRAPPGGRPVKLLTSAMATLFLFAVAVQYNDPDALRWMAIYGLAALACGLWLARRLPRLDPPWSSASRRWPGRRRIAPARVVGRVSVGDLFESYAMKSEPVEEAREMGGLLIVAVWMVVLALARPHPTR